MDVTKKYIHYCPINVYWTRVYNGETKELYNGGDGNLFTSLIYYAQNEISDKKTRNRVKAFLFLHTLPLDFDKISENLVCNDIKKAYNKRGGIDVAPYGYWLFLGALIWRCQYFLGHGNTDPIIRSINGDEFCFNESGYNTMLNKVKAEYADYPEYCLNTTDKGLAYSKFISSRMTPYTQVQLQKLFEEFADTTFVNDIAKYCELRKSKSKTATYDDAEVIGYDEFREIYDVLTSNPINRSDFMQSVTRPLIISSNKKINRILRGEQEYRTVGTDKYYITNFKDNYVFAYAIQLNLDGAVCLKTYFSDESPVQNSFREIIYKKVAIATIPIPEKRVVKNEDLTAFYLSPFSDELEKLAMDSNDDRYVSKDERKEFLEGELDLKCEMYMTIKNIWDRWLSIYYNLNQTNAFTVENFYQPNFVFIDSFYNNIYDKLKLNCRFLLDEFIGNNSNQTKLGKTTIAHLGSVASEHNSMLFNFPDNVNFVGVNQSSNTSINNYMYSLFTPTTKITPPEYSNKFTFIYTHSANRLETVDRNKFNHDSFDIWSYEDGTQIAPDIFKTSSAAKIPSNQQSKMAYKIPSFGVAYSRQNNSFWKRINVSMDNFSVTEQAIRTESMIAEKGNTEQSNIVYYGQDIYSLYQSYSYLVTVEMMGDAQIQPLMYFQLLNVPMFRGTYMIIRVEHSITPGNMITTFTGMKMSKVQVPYTSQWFTFPEGDNVFVPDDDFDEASDDNYKITTNEGYEIDLCDDDFSSVIINTTSGSVDSNSDAFTFVNEVYYSHYEITPFDEAIDFDDLGDVTNFLKHKENWSMVELRVPATDETDWASLYINRSSYPVVGDLLFGECGFDNRYPHVGVYLGMHRGNKIVAEGLANTNSDAANHTNTIQVVSLPNSRFSKITHYVHYQLSDITQCRTAPRNNTSSSNVGDGDANFDYDRVVDNGMYPYQSYDYAANNMNPPTRQPIMPENHKIPVTALSNDSMSNKDNCIELMGYMINDGFVPKPGSVKEEYIDGDGRVRLTALQAAAIAGVFYQESRWNPESRNEGYTNDADGGAYGIPQWRWNRQHKNWYTWYNGLTATEKANLGLTNIDPGGVKKGAANMTTVKQQWEYIKYEWAGIGTYCGTYQLFKDNPASTIRIPIKNSAKQVIGYRYHLTGNLMYWKNINYYDEGALCDMVYRFEVGYEDGDAPIHTSEVAFDSRCRFAKTAYNIWKEHRQS